jgi:hypothetical protein
MLSLTDGLSGWQIHHERHRVSLVAIGNLGLVFGDICGVREQTTLRNDEGSVFPDQVSFNLIDTIFILERHRSVCLTRHPYIQALKHLLQRFK